MCQRCKKSKRTCRRSPCVVHSENAYASGLKKRPRGPRVAPAPDTTNELKLIVCRVLPMDLKARAITYYMHYHLQTHLDDLDLSKGVYGDSFPIWVCKARNDPIVELAVVVVALAVFSHSQKHVKAAEVAAWTFHQLLQTTRTSIASVKEVKEVNIDTYLVAMFCMCRYVDAVYDSSPAHMKNKFASALQSDFHYNGALAVLTVWRDRLSHKSPATDVMRHARRGMIRFALLRNLALPAWLNDGAMFGEHGLELEYYDILAQVLGLRQRLSTLLRQKQPLPHASAEFCSEVYWIDTEAQNIHSLLETWKAKFPSAWSFQKHSLSGSHSWPTRDFYSQSVYHYSSPVYAAIWNQYFAAAMLVKSTHLKLHQFLRTDDLLLQHWQQSLECASHITKLSNDLASSIPYCLQRFNIKDTPSAVSEKPSIKVKKTEELDPYLASLTAWPLIIASGIKDLDRDKRLWFRSELVRVGKIVGSGVLKCAENDPWLSL